MVNYGQLLTDARAQQGDTVADIKIIMACHRDDIAIPKNDLIYPIQVGAALAPWHFEGMLHDDEGDNISEKNPYYCELTAQYWAWKNLEADYYGLFHYRRYFSFAEERFPTNHFADVLLDVNDEETLKKIGLEEGRMRSVIEQYDFILPERGQFVDKLTMREQYEVAVQHHIEDLDCVLEILQERHPEMMDAANSYLDGRLGYFCNMFIMKKDLFFDYCEWLFDILAEHERRRDFSLYDPKAYRVSGYLAERLLGVYFTWLKSQGTYKYKELQRPFFTDVVLPKPPKPIASLDGRPSVALVLSANEYYVPYMGTLLESIKENASPSRTYDVIVLHRDITSRSQEVLRRVLSPSNFSLRFFDTTRIMRDYESKLFLRGHFRIETYFRLLMQDILPGYDKALYLDSDMVVNHDIAELFDVDVDGYLLAAVQDADTAGLYNGFEPQKKDYIDNVMKMKDPYSYFQAGTILFNLAEFRRRYTVDEMFEYATSYEWELLDQDVLNHFAEGSVKYLDMRWNVMMDWANIRIDQIIGRAPRPLYLRYMESRKDPYIVHYAGPDKPWDNYESDFADFFWGYAQRTPFLPTILERSLTRKLEEKESLTQKVGKVVKPAYVKLFPDHTRRREKVGLVIRKMTGRA